MDPFLIWDDKALSGDLLRHLRQPKRRSKHRAQAKSTGLNKLPNRVGIEYRPAKLDERRFIGHWEGGTVPQGHKQSGLVTLVERRSGYLLAARLPKISAKLTNVAMIHVLTLVGPLARPSHWTMALNSQTTRPWPRR